MAASEKSKKSLVKEKAGKASQTNSRNNKASGTVTRSESVEGIKDNTPPSLENKKNNGYRLAVGSKNENSSNTDTERLVEQINTENRDSQYIKISQTPEEPGDSMNKFKSGSAETTPGASKLKQKSKPGVSKSMGRFFRKKTVFNTLFGIASLSIFLLVMLPAANAGIVISERRRLVHKGKEINTENEASAVGIPSVGNDGSKQFRLRVIHTNDLHAKIDPFSWKKHGESCKIFDHNLDSKECPGGLARVYSVINKLRSDEKLKKEGYESLLIDAGDQLQGSLYYSYYKGDAMANIIKNFGYDAMTLGNHEFDEGPLRLAEYLEKHKIPVVSSNVVVDKERLGKLDKLLKKNYVIPRLKLGFIGLTTLDTAWSSSGGKYVNFTNYVDAVNREIKNLKGQGINRIILISHIGYAQDKQLAEKIDKGVSLIIGGHSHTYLSPTFSESKKRGTKKDEDAEGEKKQNEARGKYPTVISNGNWNTTIVQAKCWGEYVGCLDVVFDENGQIIDNFTKGVTVHVDNSTQSDPIIEKEIEKYRTPLLEFMNQKVGETKKDIKYIDFSKTEGPASVRAESEMGNLVTRAILLFSRALPQKNRSGMSHKSSNSTDADTSTSTENNEYDVAFSLISSGTVRAGLKAGPILRKDIVRAIPYDNNIAILRTSGKVILESLKAMLLGARQDQPYSANKDSDSSVGVEKKQGGDEAEKMRREAKKKVRGFVYMDGIRFNYTRVFKRVKTTNNDIKPKYISVDILDKVYVQTEPNIRSSNFSLHIKDWELLDPKKNYTFSTIDFVANGGDNIFDRSKGDIVDLTFGYNKLFASQNVTDTSNTTITQSATQSITQSITQSVTQSISQLETSDADKKARLAKELVQKHKIPFSGKGVDYLSKFQLEHINRNKLRLAKKFKFKEDLTENERVLLGMNKVPIVNIVARLAVEMYLDLESPISPVLDGRCVNNGPLFSTSS
ncbi:Apyrase [Zancudomyces culisetae]|uniref:Apyrase n=1 Tax=Zancudomyces culisetae TaxID=1213189 RepID=A0A1R1PYA4_ZANCU|nr:Apyrase [Zancudomyces culisetae]|eukprot:OMH85943.1 Apyrase [Zancudomyces culisetae]